MPRHVAQTIATDFKSSFLSCEKDQEIILRKLFVENRPHSDQLKRLLIINTPDCLDDSKRQYTDLINQYDLSRLKKEQYIKITPKLALEEFDEVKSYILLEFSDIIPSGNPEFRNMTVAFTILCHLDSWELEDYKLRPYQIAGYIDGILNNAKLSGIGTFNFMGASEMVLNEHVGGIVMQYMAVHENQEDKNNEIVDNPNLELY